jgi:hypothetical protein
MSSKKTTFRQKKYPPAVMDRAGGVANGEHKNPASGLVKVKSG